MKFKVSILASLVLICSLLPIITGCASIPSQFADVTPPLSKTDMAIVKACANIQQGLPAVEIAVSTGTPLLLNQTIKTPATLIRVGGFINLVAKSVEASATGTIPDANVITTAAGKLNTSVNLSQSEIDTINSITKYAQTEYASLYAQLNTLATNATDPSVKAYALQTLATAAQTVAKGVDDGTGQYAR